MTAQEREMVRRIDARLEDLARAAVLIGVTQEKLWKQRQAIAQGAAQRRAGK